MRRARVAGGTISGRLVVLRSDPGLLPLRLGTLGRSRLAQVLRLVYRYPRALLFLSVVLPAMGWAGVAHRYSLNEPQLPGTARTCSRNLTKIVGRGDERAIQPMR
jgi:hypothetical protein